MTDMYTMFRLMVAICFACVVVSFFLYLSLQPHYPRESNALVESGGVINMETPHSDGLYFNSKSVDELNPHTYKIISEGKNPSIILYYASWCGHCRHFVDAYNGLANETNARVLALNRDKQSVKSRKGRASHRTLPIVRFTAIDCAEYSTICSKVGVTSYPTLKTYNIGPSQDEVVGATAKKVSKILNEKFFKTKAGVNGTIAESTSSTAVPTHKQDSLSYASSPEQRWHDATMSLSFLLLSELPAAWTEAQKSSLLEFTKMVLTLYPITSRPESMQTKGLYQSVVEVLEHDDAAPHKFLSDKILALVRKVHPSSLQWNVCGVVHGGSSGLPDSGDAVTDPSSGPASGSVGGPATTGSAGTGSVGSADEPRGSNLRSGKHSKARAGFFATSSASASVSASSKDDSVGTSASSGTAAASSTVNSYHNVVRASTGSGASTGYTCGLWFLFHYIAAASGNEAYHQAVTAVAVKETIFALVRDFFGCYDCREHFMKAYESCDFGVCNIRDTDYDKLQLWLFHQHNSVTRRVFLEDTPASSTPGTGSRETSVADNLWPSAELCSSCVVSSDQASVTLVDSYKTQIYNEQSVLNYLQKAYLLSTQ